MQIKKLIFILLLSPLFSFSQKKHTVGAKETLFSIGRLYNVHPRELAEFNNIPFETGLVLGQVLKIPTEKKMAPLPPVTSIPPEKIENVAKAEVKKIDPPIVQSSESKKENKGSVPIYHTVQKKETLYQISRLYDKVPIADLKKWNNLTTDGVSEGVRLIVGYNNSATKATQPKDVVKAVDEKKVELVQESKKKEEKPVETIVAKTVEKPVEVLKKAEEEKKAEIVQEVKKTEEKTVEAVVAKTEEKNKVEVAQPIVKPEIKEVQTEKVVQSAKDFKGGYFKSAFDNQKSSGIDQSATAGTFKSTSGWDDGKYYCLHNTAPAGTILKITNKSNQKIVYAKVLDVIPDLKQNAGFNIRISNAAASALDTKEEKFEVELNDK